MNVSNCMNQGVQGKCIATPTRTTPFSKEKGAALGGTQTHHTLLTRQSALPTELPVQLSRQGSKSTTQHNTTQHKAKSNPNTLCYGTENTHLICRSRPRTTKDAQLQIKYLHESRVARQVHNKQSNTNQDNTFFKGKRSCPGWDSNPRHSAN